MVYETHLWRFWWYSWVYHLGQPADTRPGCPPLWSCCAPCATTVATWSWLGVIFPNPPGYPGSKGIGSLSKDPKKQIQGYSIEFSTFAIYFKEVHNWNEAAWNRWAIRHFFPSQMGFSYFSYLGWEARPNIGGLLVQPPTSKFCPEDMTRSGASIWFPIA